MSLIHLSSSYCVVVFSTGKHGQMIELIPTETDDPAFLSLAQRIVNGAIAALQVREVYLVYIDNWFDHKWLGWWSNWQHKDLKKLFVPPFNPNRVRSQKHFIWDANSSAWTFTGQGKPLHLRRSGHLSSRQLLEHFSKSAAFIWYSGNTVSNGAGSLMFYLSGAEDYAWYASLTRKERWKIDDGFLITRKELESFEESVR
jgi:hypothetical protein